jgi:hypothetical protein
MHRIMNDEFYIGWEDRAAPSIGKVMCKSVVVLLLIVVLMPVALVLAQRLIGTSVFEWGTLRDFSGTLRATPYPHLLVSRPGVTGGEANYSTYYLVATWKFGLDPKAMERFDGRSVSLKGTLIYRDNQTMVETKPEWISISTNDPQYTFKPAPYQSLGRQTLLGEIVDSKCFLGVMNPGQLTPHRACAIRCISGGVPPVLVVRQKEGPPIYFLLVSADGRAVNQHVLDKVAEPVEITGEVQRQGELLILHADPATYRRPRFVLERP